MAYTEQKQRNPREGEEIPIPTCEICIEPISANKRFKCKKDCSYSFCLDCITKHIEVKVEENTAEVRCPGSNCPTLLNPVSFLRLLPARVFDKWCDVLCQRKVLSWPRAYCPFPQCSVLVLNECGGTISRCQCPNCNKLFCFQCQVPWHAGYRCSEAPNNRDRNDVLFGLLFENNKWARCPGCNHAVELVAGCRVVNCRYFSPSHMFACVLGTDRGHGD
ncbi:hypothetical protein HHK36_022230 [Tetracentron sinense]|uniref:RBR-type E3 ubiquitin transferase n=1 Tax=Tetracentron sinense TaxID=13715 RepID=A0A834YRK4_TETSI|nr:hypothetical protein HHK36_022230 [Tetracentron sinense]